MMRAPLLALLAMLAAQAAAQSYPARPIRMVVPLAAGGGTDLTGRIVAQKLAEQLGGSIVVENRPGGGSVIGTEVVARAAPDGYTLMTISPEFSINPSLLKSLPYDPYRDFVCISQLTSGQYFVSTHPSVPTRTLKELIALAKSRPGQVTYGSSGNGSANHLAGVMFQMLTGTKLIHVPFKGAGPAGNALMSGEIDFMFSSTSAAMAGIRSGRLRAIAVTGPKRLALTPEIPTAEEAGVRGFVVTGWYLLMAPAATPRDIVAKLNAETSRAVHSPAVKERFATLGTEPVGSSLEECAGFVRSEIQKWEKVVKASGAKAD
ncbi:MAG TPA: tripartite tricarboxylate transporter substrate binding protein [Burkholderiales bacterium]|nr:tripartite tricarboxylate transporter substrate binding protein [Burkholderiales bacterium]